MNIYGYHTSNIKPLSSRYSLDSDVVIDDIHDYTTEGLDMSFPVALSGVEDITTNQHNTLFLTNKKKTENIISVKPKKSQYPIYRQTYFKRNGADQFLVVQESTGSTTFSGTSAAIGNGSFFEIELLNPLHCAVRHYDNTTLRYLTLIPTNSGALTFTPRVSSGSPDIDIQIFKYLLDEANDIITITQRFSAGTNSFSNVVLQKVSNSLSARVITVTDTTPFSNDNKFQIRPVASTSTDFDLQSTWTSYISAVDENSLNVDLNSTVQNLQNNYLVSTETDSIGFSSREVDINLLPLKNQVTIEGSVSRNNPYDTQEDEVTHREYHTLHTGTYQEHGDDSIYLGYTAGVKELKFESDSLTYFHVPQKFSPFSQANVNDTSLVKAGGVASDSPLKSDKVFKKLSPEDITIPKDELNGLWLCTWLSGAPDSNTTPVWVDRFFNPKFITRAEALSSGLLSPITYVDKFDSLTKTLGASAQNVTVYDKSSDLIFEPGILYAYHHVGRGNSQRNIDSLEGHRLVKDFAKYVNINGALLVPELDTNERTHTMANGVVMTSTTHQIDSVDVPLVYSFNRESYGITDLIKHTGSFTINFWMHADSWDAPIGDQLVGNYINKGFGIYSEPFVTPFIVVPDGKSVHVYNSDYKYIDSYFIGKTIKHIVKKGSLDNFWIMDDNNDIYEYSINGIALNKISSSLLTGKNVIDIDISEQYIYALIQPAASSTTAQYFKFDLTNQTAGYTGVLATENVWNPTIGTSSTTYKLHTVSKGVSAGQGILIVRQEALSGGSATSNPLTGTISFGSGSTVDIHGNPWTVQNNYIYTYDQSTSANIQAISAQEIIEGVHSDKTGNIWVLHDYNKVSKLDNDRNLIFTTNLSAIMPAVSSVRYNRYMDFVYEFDQTGYTNHAIIINQSLSGCKSISVRQDGSIKTFATMLTGSSRVQTDIVTFFSTPMVSSFSLSAHSWKSVTGFDYLKKHKLNTTPRIEAKIALTNIYNSSTSTHSYSGYTLTLPTSGLKRGWHNFNVLLNAETGRYEMHVDGHLVDNKTIHSGRYSYSDIFDQPLTVGSSPYLTKFVIGEQLQQKYSYLANGLKIKNFKLYDTALSYYDILSHYTVVMNTNDMKWDISTGQRNYIDTVERVFKHKIPGRKSDVVDINIKNTLLTDVSLKNELQDKILQNVNNIMPINVKIRQFTWDGLFTEVLSGSSGLKNISITTPNTDIASTTPSTQGGTQSYDY